MGLFEDDFYSTKATAGERKRWSGGRRPKRPPIGRQNAAIAGLSVLCGLLLLLLAGGNDRPAIDAPVSMSPAEGSRPMEVADVVQALKPAVVSVISAYSEGSGMPGWDQTAIGSGIIYKKENSYARIVTNHHVIDGAVSIEVVLSDGERLDARKIGTDLLSDLAVLEVDGRSVKGVAAFGNSDELREGDAAIAIGHPFGLGHSPTFTLGIISSLSRTIPVSLSMDGNIDWEMELLQTDAAINQGNSGGALVNLFGKVIGINSMKVARPGVEGLGFAIPSNIAVPIIEELEQYGKIRRPYLGVATVDLKNYRNRGNSVEELKLPRGVKDGIVVLEARGPAAEAGIRTHDVIVSLDGTPIDSTLALRKYLYAHKRIGDPIRVELYRQGKKMTVEPNLGESPADP